MKNSQIILGLHSVQSSLKNAPDRIQKLLILKERADQKIKEIIQLAEKNKIKVEWVGRKQLDELTKNENHQGVIAFCHTIKTYHEEDLFVLLDQLTVPAFLLILDGIQDPHNLGACMRTADAAGVHAVIAPKDKSVGLTPTVSKVASGALEAVPFIQVTNLARTLTKLKAQNIWLIGAAEDAPQLYSKVDMTMSLGIVMGAEGSGLRRLTKEHCDFLVNIPMHGAVSSLNVSVATGILLFEAVRQRMQKSR